jgi:hypothetical protein
LAGFTRRFASHVRRNGERIVVKRGDLGKNHGGRATAPLQSRYERKSRKKPEKSEPILV